MATKAAEQLTVSQLENLLNRRQSQLDHLLRKRDQILRDLNNVEQKIRAIEGSGNGQSTVRRVSKRPKNEKSLHTVVREVLKKHKAGLKLDPLNKKVLATGYKSNSANFKNVLYQCLYHSNEIVHEPETGRYRLNS